MSIGNVKFQLQEKYQKRFNLEKSPDIIMSNEIGNIKKREPFPKIQLAAVKPYFEDNEASDRRTGSIFNCYTLKCKYFVLVSDKIN
jgi:hypothetical protein